MTTTSGDHYIGERPVSYGGVGVSRYDIIHVCAIYNSSLLTVFPTSSEDGTASLIDKSPK